MGHQVRSSGRTGVNSDLVAGPHSTDNFELPFFRCSGGDGGSSDLVADLVADLVGLMMAAGFRARGGVHPFMTDRDNINGILAILLQVLLSTSITTTTTTPSAHITAVEADDQEFVYMDACQKLVGSKARQRLCATRGSARQNFCFERMCVLLPVVGFQEESSRSRVSRAPGGVPGEAFQDESSSRRIPGVPA